MAIDYGKPNTLGDESYRRDAGGPVPELGSMYGLASAISGGYSKQADAFGARRIGTQFSDQSRQLANDSAARESAALEYQRQIASGQIESPAEQQARAGVGQAQDTQSALAASARGGPGMSAAARNAANQQAMIGVSAQNQIAAARANEMAAARDRYGALAGQMRSSDQELWNLGQQRELGQAQLNDEGVLASQRMANEISGAQMTADSSAYNARTGADLSAGAQTSAANRQADAEKTRQAETAAAALGSAAMLASDIRVKTDVTPQGKQNMATPPNMYPPPPPSGQGQGLAQALMPQVPAAATFNQQPAPQPAAPMMQPTPTFSDIRAKSGVMSAGATAPLAAAMQTQRMPMSMPDARPPMQTTARPMVAPNMQAAVRPMAAPGMPAASLPPARPPMQQMANPAPVSPNAMMMSDKHTKDGISEGTKGEHRGGVGVPTLYSDERVKEAAFQAGQDAAHAQHEAMAKIASDGEHRISPSHFTGHAPDTGGTIERGEMVPPSNPHAEELARRQNTLDQIATGNGDRNALIDSELARMTAQDRRVNDLASKIRSTSRPAPSLPPMQYVESTDLNDDYKRSNDYAYNTNVKVPQTSRTALIRSAQEEEGRAPPTLYSDPRVKAESDPPYLREDPASYSTGEFWPSEMVESRIHDRIGGRIMSDATLKYVPEHGLSSAYGSRSGRGYSDTGDASMNFVPKHPADAHLMPAPKRSLSHVMSDEQLKTVDARPVYKERYSDEQSKSKRSLAGVMSDEDVKIRRPGGTTEADDFLSTLTPYSYKYKDPSYEPTDHPTGGRYLGVMAQRVATGPTGDTIVKDTPRGKALEGGALMSALSAGEGRLHERLSALEAEMGKSKKSK